MLHQEYTLDEANLYTENKGTIDPSKSYEKGLDATARKFHTNKKEYDREKEVMVRLLHCD